MINGEKCELLKQMWVADENMIPTNIGQIYDERIYNIANLCLGLTSDP